MSPELTIREDFNEHFLRLLDVVVHHVLYPDQKIEWLVKTPPEADWLTNHKVGTSIQYPTLQPTDHTTPRSRPYYYVGDIRHEIPFYHIAGEENVKLQEEMTKAEWTKLEIFNRHGDRGYVVYRTNGSITYDGIGVTIPLAVFACFCSWKGVRLE